MAKKEVTKAGCKEGGHKEIPGATPDPESVPAMDKMRLSMGDILRMRRSNAYCRPGKYAILSLDTTVCLARTKKKTHHRRLTNDLVYFLITDLVHFEPTGKQYRPILKRR